MPGTRITPRALLAVLLSGVWAAAAQQMPPVDEAATDPSWLRFKARLLQAVEKRDQKFVMGIVDTRVRNISTTAGAAEFRKLWEPQSADSPLWQELRRLLFLGSVYVRRDKNVTELCAPYVYYKWPDHAEPDAAAAITAREALAKAQPSAGADTVQTLSYHLVKVLDWEVDDLDKASGQKWVQIQTAAGASFVPEEQVRSPLEYRACFARRGNGWRLTGIEAGE